MPVILEPEDYDRWLDAGTTIDALRAMLRPLPADRMRAEAVSRAVNSVKNDNEECIEPIGEPALSPAHP
jgi:putative SOS response-associated peptidase YedK